MRAITRASMEEDANCLGGEDLEIASMLNPAVQRLICEKGWRQLTPIQRKAIPRILAGDNVLAMAPTGHGKTEAALLPVLSQMLQMNRDGRGIYVLYITPLKALINDLTLRIEWWASRLGFNVGRKHGDVPQIERMKRHRTVPEIMITTPESLEIDLDWATKFRKYYSTVSWVIIDEVHELVGTKRGAQLAVLLERLYNMSGKEFQRILLSATVGDPEKVARYFSGSSQRNISIVKGGGYKDLRFSIVSIDEKNSDPIEGGVKELTKNIEPPTLVFTNSRYVAERIYESLEKTGFKRMAVHHSSVSHELRESIEDEMRKGNIDVVIATKTLELGIDVGCINKVIMFRPPGQVVSLLQRVGRSGHSVDEVSKGAIIALDNMDILVSASLISLLADGYLEKPYMIENPLDVLAREIVGWVLRGGSVSLDTIYRVIRRAYPFRNLEWSTFAEVISEMVKNGVLEYSGNNTVGLGKNFFNIWRFDQKWRSSRMFTEFFTFISESTMFAVRSGDKIVGYLDDQYVFRILRIGDVIRIGGRLWRISRIDEDNMIIDVSPTDESNSMIPLWRGETPTRSRAVAEKFYEMLSNGFSINNNILDMESAKLVESTLEEIRSWFVKNKVPIPSRDTVVIEDLGEEEVMLYPFGDKMAEAVGYLFLYMASKREGMDVGVRVTPFGISIKASNTSFKTLLKEIGSGEYVDEIIGEALKRSPKLSIKVKEIQHSFGYMGRVPEESVVFKEAIRQILEDLESEGSVRSFFSGLASGEIKIYIVPKRTPPSPISKKILSTPLIRPWLRDISYIVAKLLKGFAMTVTEVAEALELPEKVIENKLKEMRKGGPYRAIQFKDIDTGEWRWALVEDLEALSKSPEFQACFVSKGIYDHIECSLKYEPGSAQVKFVIKTSDLDEGIKRILENVSTDEIYEVRVSPISALGLKEASIAYYNVPKDAFPYIVKNAIAYIEKTSTSY
ncbi:MAG TPA: DEAD/DEAH box helicase [Sulfolobales archaeon]|nr:DEAD/DEAH box helicase [Sulfolobales archaeon]